MSDHSHRPPFDEDDATGGPLSPREKAMGFFDHLEELRWTIVKCAVVYLFFAVLIGVFLKDFNQLLLWPLHSAQQTMPDMTVELGTTSIMEGFSVTITMCCLGALIPATPFIFYFLAQFVAPALTEPELRLVMPGCIGAFLLFAAGSAFSFFLLVPNTIKVAAQLNEFLGFITRWTPGSYYSLMAWLTVGVGASFEFPLVLLILVHLGLVTVATLKRYRRHAAVVFFVIAAIVTPTPDPFTQTMFAVPLYLLFEAALLVGARVERARARRLAAG